MIRSYVRSWLVWALCRLLVKTVPAVGSLGHNENVASVRVAWSSKTETHFPLTALVTKARGRSFDVVLSPAQLEAHGQHVELALRSLREQYSFKLAPDFDVRYLRTSPK